MALRKLGLDEVWWLVSPQNPLKREQGMAPFADRISYARQVARHPRIRVSDIERRLGTRYSIDTVRALKRRFPGYVFVWLMGADILTQMPAWKRWSAFFNTVAIAVFARPSYSLKALASQAAIRFARYRLPEEKARLITRKPPPAWVFVRIRLHEASATDMRESGQTVSEILNADTRSGD